MLLLAFQTTFVLSVAALLSLVLRQQSAARRHSVWAFALVAILLLPITPRMALAPIPLPRLPRAAELSPGPVRTVVEVVGYDRPAAAGRKFALWAWAVGALALAGRFGRSYWLAHRLRRHSEPFAGGVFITGGTHIPLVVGLRHPVILLPLAARQWPPGQLESVLAHERMHVERRDLWWQFLGHVACCLYWPQPLVWLSVRALRKECEQACDDGVLVGGVLASEYAGHLVTIGRAAVSQPRAALAGAITMTHSSLLEKRVSAILNPLLNRRTTGWGFMATGALAAGLMVLTLASLQAPAWAQARTTEQTGTARPLAGVVQDASGGMIARARIDVRGTNDFHEVIYSGAAGDFVMSGVPDGDYDLTVSMPGFARMHLAGVRFDAAKAHPLELTLEVGSLNESVQVQAQGPVPLNPATASGLPRRIRVGGNVQAAKLEYKAPIAYPPTAKADRVQGTVLLRAVVGRDGSVVSLEQINKLVDKRLVDAALEAVKQWRYSPTLLNGQPVEILTVVEVNFTLSA